MPYRGASQSVDLVHTYFNPLMRNTGVKTSHKSLHHHNPGPAIESLPQATLVSKMLLNGSTCVNLMRATLNNLPQLELYSPINVRDRASIKKSAILTIFL